MREWALRCRPGLNSWFELAAEGGRGPRRPSCAWHASLIQTGNDLAEREPAGKGFVPAGMETESEAWTSAPPNGRKGDAGEDQ